VKAIAKNREIHGYCETSLGVKKNIYFVFFFFLDNPNSDYSMRQYPLWLILVNCETSEILIYLSFHIIITALFKLAYRFG